MGTLPNYRIFRIWDDKPKISWNCRKDQKTNSLRKQVWSIHHPSSSNRMDHRKIETSFLTEASKSIGQMDLYSYKDKEETDAKPPDDNTKKIDGNVSVVQKFASVVALDQRLIVENAEMSLRNQGDIKNSSVPDPCGDEGLSSLLTSRVDKNSSKRQRNLGVRHRSKVTEEDKVKMK